MKRREAIASLAALVGATGGPAAGAAQPPAQTPDCLDDLLRDLWGVNPLPGEARAVRQYFMFLRSGSRSDPREEPALRFDPEVDFEP